MTPHELQLAVDAEQSRQQGDLILAVTQAYYAAAWWRAKKMPRLKDVIRKMQPKHKELMRRQTPEEQLQQALRWQKRFEEGED